MVVPRTVDDVENLEFKDISMRVGIHKRTFVKNVVAIGLSAGFIEPLESNGLFSVHEFLFKLVDILQRGQISQFDRNMYNVSVKDLFDGFSKFVALHYALSHRNDSEYWRSIQDKEFTDKYGAPHFPYTGRSDAFYDIGWRYMDEWGHPYGQAGIPYIATGMNLRMLNEARVLDLQTRSNKNLQKEINEVIDVWEARKKRWDENAKKALSLEQFLKEKFYPN